MADPGSLSEVRARIDDIDADLIRLLAERQFLVRAAAAFKPDEQAVRAPDRVEEVISMARQRAMAAGLDPAVAGGMADDHRCLHQAGDCRALWT